MFFHKFDRCTLGRASSAPQLRLICFTSAQAAENRDSSVTGGLGGSRSISRLHGQQYATLPSSGVNGTILTFEHRPQTICDNACLRKRQPAQACLGTRLPSALHLLQIKNFSPIKILLKNLPGPLLQPIRSGLSRHHCPGGSDEPSGQIQNYLLDSSIA